MGNSDHLTDGAERLGADPRNLQWADDQSRFSYKHLQTLGWSDSQGLGNTFLGNPNHIIVSRKSDNGGIGMQRARKEGDDQAAGAGQAGQGLEDVLKRLAGGSASPSPAPEGITKSERSEGRISSRRKHLHSKRKIHDSPTALAEILGVPVSSLPVSPQKTSASALSSTAHRPNDASAESSKLETISTSSASVEDYFRQKMREKLQARQRAADDLRQAGSIVSAASNLSQTKADDEEAEQISTKKKRRTNEVLTNIVALDVTVGADVPKQADRKGKRRKQQ